MGYVRRLVDHLLWIIRLAPHGPNLVTTKAQRKRSKGDNFGEGVIFGIHHVVLRFFHLSGDALTLILPLYALKTLEQID